MVNLKAVPYELSDEDINWVNKTLQQMTLEEKVGQLFCGYGIVDDEIYQNELIHKYHVGGIMCRAGAYEEIKSIHSKLQKNSKIPMLIASNLETGGNGQVVEGTLFGTQMEVGATKNTENAYHLGAICGHEASAVGGNWAFAPVMDLNINFRSPIVGTRAYGNDPDLVLAMGKEYLRGLKESNMAASAKHFPGDGMDDRDQHLLPSVNTCSIEEWDATYGKIYKGMIDAGVQTIMVGHILLPAYTKKLQPEIQDDEIMPASLAPEIMTDLLRGKLGFNGMVVTDATAMAGFTQLMTRKEAVPRCIMAGADMFLFHLNLETDYQYMLDGMKDGVLTMERVNEAVMRILGTKAALGLHKKISNDEDLRCTLIRCEVHREWTRTCADEAITLVKNKHNIVPISPEKYKKVLLIVLGDNNGAKSHSGGDNYSDLFQMKLEKEGFKVTRLNPEEEPFEFDQMFKKGWHIIDNYDLVLYYANEGTYSSSTEVRARWSKKEQMDAVKFAVDKPYVFISVAWPYHLQDVPRVQAYINCYASNREIVDCLVEKLMGRSEFKGANPVDPFCGYWDARL